MPRQEILSPAHYAQLLASPTDTRQVAEFFTFSPADLDLIAQRRGEPNRLGFAIQLGITPDRMAEYAARDETRREHLAELLAVFEWRTFGLPEQGSE